MQSINNIKRYLICIQAILLSIKGFSNNVVLSNINLLSKQTISVTLDWNNAWNVPSNIEPGNHDAIYMFLKGMRSNGEWTTIALPYDSLEYSILGYDKVYFKPSLNKIGVIIIPSKSALLFRTQIAIQLNQTLDTFSKLMLVGIEMVYIPNGPFYVGDQMSIGRLGTKDSLLPFKIVDEAVIQVRNGNKSLYAHYDANIDHSTNVEPYSDIPAAFPKGTKGFYCMKYEISQEQYVQFLNCLTYTQQVVRTDVPKIYSNHYLINTNGSAYGNGITADLTKNPIFFYNDLQTNNAADATDDGHTKACNYLSWSDLIAYLDWSGMRPMTELEYEKICRGPLYPKPREYAWGNDSMIDATTINNLGSPNEHCTDTIPNHYGFANRGNYKPGIDLPVLRSGFAANASSDRLRSGGTYFGVKEMTGNVWEMVINLSKPGLNFTGSLGDGRLDENGQATNPDWDIQVQGAGGVKGGGWNSGIQLPYNDCAVSDRFYIYQIQNAKRNTTGGRGIVTIE